MGSFKGVWYFHCQSLQGYSQLSTSKSVGNNTSKSQGFPSNYVQVVFGNKRCRTLEVQYSTHTNLCQAKLAQCVDLPQSKKKDVSLEESKSQPWKTVLAYWKRVICRQLCWISRPLLQILREGQPSFSHPLGFPKRSRAQFEARKFSKSSKSLSSLLTTGPSQSFGARNFWQQDVVDFP